MGHAALYSAVSAAGRRSAPGVTRLHWWSDCRFGKFPTASTGPAEDSRAPTATANSSAPIVKKEARLVAAPSDAGHADREGRARRCRATRPPCCKQLAQRDAELALIHAIQRGTAPGSISRPSSRRRRKLRELCASTTSASAGTSRPGGPRTSSTRYEHGKRIDAPPYPPSEGGPWQTMLKTRQPVVVATRRPRRVRSA